MITTEEWYNNYKGMNMFNNKNNNINNTIIYTNNTTTNNEPFTYYGIDMLDTSNMGSKAALAFNDTGATDMASMVYYRLQLLAQNINIVTSSYPIFLPLYGIDEVKEFAADNSFVIEDAVSSIDNFIKYMYNTTKSQGVKDEEIIGTSLNNFREETRKISIILNKKVIEDKNSVKLSTIHIHNYKDRKNIIRILNKYETMFGYFAAEEPSNILIGITLLSEFKHDK